jgi:hypothetical protein
MVARGIVGRGVWVAAVLLLATGFAGVGAAPVAQGACGPALAQDDAESGTDAGPSPDEAEPLEREEAYAASIGYPSGGGADTVDMYEASVTGEGPWTVMVEVDLSAGQTLYDTVDTPRAQNLEIAAYPPGADEPAHEATADDRGAQLSFETDEPGAWHLEVSLAGPDGPSLCTGTNSASDAPADNYAVYWGCHPHCLLEDA